MNQDPLYILQLKQAYDRMKELNEQHNNQYSQALYEADIALKQALSYEFGIKGEHGTACMIENLNSTAPPQQP